MKIIEIKNDMQELNRLTEIIELFCKKNKLNLRFTFQLNLIFEEIITNIVSYGYSDEVEHKIQIELDVLNNYLFCSIIDDGSAFDPLIVDKPKLDEGVEERKIGGLGIHFVKTMIDDISYERIEGKNTLNFKKMIGQED